MGVRIKKVIAVVGVCVVAFIGVQALIYSAAIGSYLLIDRYQTRQVQKSESRKQSHLEVSPYKGEKRYGGVTADDYVLLNNAIRYVVN